MDNNVGNKGNFLALMIAIVSGVLISLALPGISHAAKANFGADLKAGGYTPVAAPMDCTAMPGSSCLRVPEYYDSPPHAGMVPFAPKNGVIKKIKLVSDTPGKLKIMLADHLPGGDTKIVGKGPRIKYLGTGSIEKFKVHIPVKKYEWLAFKSKSAGTLSCGSGFDVEEQFQPALKVGQQSAMPSATSDCTHLIGARMKY